MTSDDERDDTRQELERLRQLAPDAARGARLRARCHAQLARRKRRWERAAVLVEVGRRWLAPVAVLGLCVAYITSVIGQALRLRGLF